MTAASCQYEDDLENDRITEPKWYSRYHNSWCQLVILSLIYFAEVGMWNALNAIGGLGTGDADISHRSNTILYGSSIIGGLIAGSSVNIFGLRVSAIIGSSGNCLVILTVYLVFYHNFWGGLTTLAVVNALCGLLVNSMLAAVASGLVNYPVESERSTFLAVGSCVLNLGGLLGALISFGMNYSDTDAAAGLSNSSFVVILAISGFGILASCVAANPEKVIRSDGSHPKIPIVPFKEELRAIKKGFQEPLLQLMVPMFMCSLWHEVTIFNYFNISLFNVRSRALNAVWYYLGRICASFIFQYACDIYEDLGQRIMAALLCCIGFLIVAFATAIATLCNAYNIRDFGSLDFTEPRSILLVICFFAYGSLETIATSFSFWLIGVLPFNDVSLANRFVGWYRLFSALGGCLSWLLDSTNTVSNLTQWIISAALWVIAIGCIFILRHIAISK